MLKAFKRKVLKLQYGFSNIHFVQVNYLPQNVLQCIYHLSYHQYMNSTTTDK